MTLSVDPESIEIPFFLLTVAVREEMGVPDADTDAIMRRISIDTSRPTPAPARRFTPECPPPRTVAPAT